MILRRVKKTNREILSLLLPIILIFVVFNLVPFIISFIISLFKDFGTKKSEFTGIETYKFLLTEDSYFRKGTFATLMILLFGVLPQHLIALPLALLLNNKFIRGKNFFRLVFFMPYILSAVAVSLLFMSMFSEKSGVINYLLNIFGLPIIPRFNDDAGSFLMVMSAAINWRNIGWNLILYQAGLSAIPEALYEAADIEGASNMTKHRFITLPYMIPIFFFTITLSIVNGMQIFDEPYILYGGTLNMIVGRSDLGRPLTVYIIWLLQQTHRIDRGSAVAWILFIVILVFTVINKKLLNRFEK
ncbi:MAG: sugar ABC transporter permease [Spirochaetales bacterium]|nr:sugar ABC transporter permease [Spirochaetales bacterium]